MGKTISLVLALALGLTAQVADADFAFGTSTNLGPKVNSPAFEGSPDISRDGLSLFFDAYSRPGGPGDWDLWVTTRDATNGDWGEAVPLPLPINSSYADAGPTISADGLSLFFASNRPGGCGGFDLWVTTRKTAEDPWEPPLNLGYLVNSLADENHASISADGLSLYFDCNWFLWLDYDIFVATRASINDDWDIPEWLGPATDAGLYDWSPSISSDGLALFFEGRSQSGDRELLVTRRKTADDNWEDWVNIGSSVNTTYDDGDPSISSDGYTLYFCSGRPGGVGNRDLWQVPIVPIIDFNADALVDLADFCRLAQCWFGHESSGDIAPGPFGDCIVDYKDLAVLGQYWLQAVDDPTLVAHWKLDESQGNVAAEIVAGKDGTVYGDAVWQPQGGKVGGALQFDGLDDYVATPFVLNPAEGEFSLFAWVKGEVPGQVVVSQKYAANWLRADPSEGKLATELKSGGRFGHPLISQTVITDGRWHQVALVWDGANRTLCVDNVEVACDTQADLASSESSLYFGAGKNLEAGSLWSGVIDDVRIYNRAVTP